MNSNYSGKTLLSVVGEVFWLMIGWYSIKMKVKHYMKDKLNLERRIFYE